eukprot:747398-Hanusia_phi.AAC.1
MRDRRRWSEEVAGKAQLACETGGGGGGGSLWEEGRIRYAGREIACDGGAQGCHGQMFPSSSASPASHAGLAKLPPLLPVSRLLALLASSCQATSEERRNVNPPRARSSAGEPRAAGEHCPAAREGSAAPTVTRAGDVEERGEGAACRRQ